MEDKRYEKLIQSFHETWENFPGQARLIDKNHHVIAVNAFAKKNGRTPGEICAAFGAPESHRGCRKALEGWPDVVVHFSLAVPEVNS